MPIVIRCPDCGRQVRVRDEQLGKKVRCPGCKEVFNAEDDAPARARGGVDDYEILDEDDLPLRRRRDEDEYEDEEEDEDRPTKKASARAGWKKVRLGLTLYVIGLLVYMCGMVLLYLILVIAASSALRSGSLSSLSDSFLIVFVLALLVTLAWQGLRLAAMVLCVFAPNRHRTPLRLLGILSLCLCGAGSLFDTLSQLIGMLDVGMAVFAGPYPVSGSEVNVGQVVLFCLGMVCYAAWFIVFILFQRAVALDLREYDLAGLLMKFLISCAVFMGLAPILYLITFAVGAALSSSSGGLAAAGILAVLVLAAVGITGICLGIWHIVLVFQVRTVVDRRVRR
jgi:predicted Zn finger-like uncharacterized protein